MSSDLYERLAVSPDLADGSVEKHPQAETFTHAVETTDDDRSTLIFGSPLVS